MVLTLLRLVLTTLASPIIDGISILTLGYEHYTPGRFVRAILVTAAHANWDCAGPAYPRIQLPVIRELSLCGTSMPARQDRRCYSVGSRFE